MGGGVSSYEEMDRPVPASRAAPRFRGRLLGRERGPAEGRCQLRKRAVRHLELLPGRHADHHPEPGHRQDGDSDDHRDGSRASPTSWYFSPQDGGRPGPCRRGHWAGCASPFPSRADSASRTQQGDQTVSSDPDVNPAAAYGRNRPVATVAAAPSEGTLPAATPATRRHPCGYHPDSFTGGSDAGAAAGTGTADHHNRRCDSRQTPSPSDADNAAIISAAESRNPQKQVFQPPREDQKFVYQKPARHRPRTQLAAAGPHDHVGVEGEPGVSPGRARGLGSCPRRRRGSRGVASRRDRRRRLRGSRPRQLPCRRSRWPLPTLRPEGSPARPRSRVQTEVTGPTRAASCRTAAAEARPRCPLKPRLRRRRPPPLYGHPDQRRRRPRRQSRRRLRRRRLR